MCEVAPIWWKPSALLERPVEIGGPVGAGEEEGAAALAAAEVAVATLLVQRTWRPSLVAGATAGGNWLPAAG